MRTTLKRGVGRGATLNGNGRAGLSPAAAGPVTIYQQPPPPPRSGRSLAVAHPRVGGARARGGRGRDGRRRVPLPPRVGCRGRGEGPGRQGGREVAQGAAARRAGDRPRDRLRPACERGQGHAVAFGHADARPRRPGRRDDLDALVPARPAATEIRCPGKGSYVDKINSAYATCGAKGALATVSALTGLPINYIITVDFRGFRLLVDKLGGVWMDIDRRYFNDHGGPWWLRQDQPPAGVPALDRAAGARLRPLPAHRLGHLPQRASAAVRPRASRIR